MTIQAISSANGAYPQSIIEAQTKQLMRENMQEIAKQTITSVSKQIDAQYKDEFFKKINSQSKEINDNDIKIILTDLQEAYANAGMEEDSKAIQRHLNTVA